MAKPSFKCVTIVSQDDILDKADPCGSKTYVTNLVKYYTSIKLNVNYVGIITNPYSNPYKTLKIFQILNKQISTIKFVFLLFLKSPFIKIPKNTPIHAQKPLELFPFLLRKNNKKILTLHGPELKRVRFKKGKMFNFFYHFTEKFILKKADTIIIVDKGTYNYYTKEYSFLKNKIEIIPIGIDTEQFYPFDKISNRKLLQLDDKDKIIIFIGRLEKEKNVKFLIDSFELVHRKIQDTKLIIIGRGNCKTELTAHAKGKGISNIIFKGEIPNNMIPKFLSIADVLALCSIYEGSPTVIKESLACNTPVVSLDVGDVKDVLKDFGDSYIAKRDINDFADKLIIVLSSNGEIDYSKSIRQYSNIVIAQKTLDIYKK